MKVSKINKSRSTTGISVYCGWIVFLILCVVALHRLDTGSLALPSISQLSFNEWSNWIDQNELATVVFAFIRTIATIICIYLLFTTLLAPLAMLSKSSALTQILVSITIPPIRRLAANTLGASLIGVLATTNVVSPASAAPAPPIGLHDDIPTLHQITDEATEKYSSPIMRLVDPGTIPPADSPAQTGPPSTTTPSVSPTPSEPANTGTDNSYTSTTTKTDESVSQSTLQAVDTDQQSSNSSWSIQAGDSLWLVAKQTLAKNGLEPTDIQVAQYWKQLIELNSDSFTSANNPDLVFVGQKFRLPPLPQ